jgi:hypothetical protein
LNGECPGKKQHRVAVRTRLGDEFVGDHSPGAEPVLDDDRLAEALRKLLADQPPDEVRIAAYAKGDHES